MKKRIDYLDLLKTIAIIMVVGTHVPIFEYDFINGDSFVQYILKLLSEGVVIFICVNGYLLLSKEELDIKKHYLKTIKIFLLTCMWAIILIFAGVIFDKSPITRSLIVDLFLNIGSGLYVKELWFLVDLIGIYLIYPLIWLAYKQNKTIFNAFVIVLAIFVYVPEFFRMISYFAPTVERNILWNRFANELQSFSLFTNESYMLLYFCLGGVIAENKEKIHNNKAKLMMVGIVSIIISILIGYLISIKSNSTYEANFLCRTIFMIPIILLLFSIVSNYKNTCTITNVINVISKNTFGIYLIHSFIIRIFRLFIPQSNILLRLLIMLLTLLISTMVTLIMKKISIIKELFKF